MLKKYKKVRVFFPLSDEVFRDVCRAKFESLEEEKNVGQFLKFIRSHPSIGKVGNYSGVFEAWPVVESFIPQGDANPTIGKAGKVEYSPTIAFEVYIESHVPEAEMSSIIREISDLHPWETPMIEMYSFEVSLPSL